MTDEPRCIEEVLGMGALAAFLIHMSPGQTSPQRPCFFFFCPSNDAGSPFLYLFDLFSFFFWRGGEIGLRSHAQKSGFACVMM